MKGGATQTGHTRRRFLTVLGATGAAFGAAARSPWRFLVPSARGAGILSDRQLRTLNAAVARIVPAQGSGDWSAADVGADNYIITLLQGQAIFAGGPVRSRFPLFQRLWRTKQIGWDREVQRLRTLYANGLDDLDNRSVLGDFAALPGPLQDAILTQLDLSDSDFFAALYNHTMEGVYGHPVYGGNRDYTAWRSFGFAGDVHGVRFPGIGPADAPWNVFGGYAPDEIGKPGGGS